MRTTEGTTHDERAYLVAFSGITGIQTAHMVEHIAQVYERYVLSWQKAHGLIGFLDLEWVHFFFDSALLLVTSYILFIHGGRLRRASRPGHAIFAFGVFVQTYHQIEHTVKISQHLETGLQMTKGILGYYVTPMLLHFWLNFTVTACLIISFFLSGAHRRLAATFARTR